MRPHRSHSPVPSVPLAALAAALVGSTGCLALLPGGASGPVGGTAPASACRALEADGEVAPAAGLAEQVVLLSCVDRTRDTRAIVAHHQAFDDRRFDHLRAALMVVDCALNDECVKVELGMLEWYARRLDEAPLGRALDRLQLAPEIRAAFLGRVSGAREVLAARLAEMDPRRRHMYIEVPNRVRAERQAYFERHAELYAQLDPLLAEVAEARAALQVPDDLPARLTAVRDAYLRRCKGAGCRHDPLVAEVTRELVMLHVIEKDAPRALAEAALLHEPQMARAGYHESLLAAQLEATAAEAEAWDTYQRAVRDGADRQALRAMFGEVPPVQVSPDGPALVWGHRREPDPTAVLDRSGLRSAGGEVKRVVPQGPHSKVVFADVVTRYEDADCVETGKIDYITDDGRIVYRRKCSNQRTRTERQEVDPILVPREEAAHLRPGELVSAQVEATSARGHILSVRRKNELVQVRSHRLSL